MANRSRADIRRGVHTRIRKKVQGTSERPRLAVFRSVKHIYAQVIDDVKGVTLAAASTTEGSFKGKSGGNVEAAATVGKTIAERAKSAGISTVVYDRGGYVYHGRIRALIEATREAGLNQEGSADAAKPEEAPKAVEKKPAGKKAGDKKADDAKGGKKAKKEEK